MADRVTALLGRAGITSRADPKRGFDHGVFIPLLLIFPDADIPVIQLSLLDTLHPVAHLDAGRALASMREEGVLIIGSGMSFHNMRGYGDPHYGPISDDFDRWLTTAVEAEPNRRTQALAGWAEVTSARLSHPPRAEEHLLPLMVVAGAAGDDRGRRVFSARGLETRLCLLLRVISYDARVAMLRRARPFHHIASRQVSLLPGGIGTSGCIPERSGTQRLLSSTPRSRQRRVAAGPDKATMKAFALQGGRRGEVRRQATITASGNLHCTLRIRGAIDQGYEQGPTNHDFSQGRVAAPRFSARRRTAGLLEPAMTLPSIFDSCEPRPEVLAGELPDAIFAADLWDVIRGKAHEDYQDPLRFFDGTYPTQNLKRLVKDVLERLAGVQGVTCFFKLEDQFGGGKTHLLIACVHVGRHGSELVDRLSDYEVRRYPDPGTVSIAVFVGENSSPLEGVELEVEGQRIRTYTPWGQLALMAGGVAGYECIKESDLNGVVPAREDLEKSLGDGPLLILIDELVLYMARCFAMPPDHPRGKINSQWPTFLQTLSSIASQRPKTVVLLTLPTEKDANARFTGDLKQHVAAALEMISETADAAIRKASSLTPTQSTERGAVLARRLFNRVDYSKASKVAEAYVRYYETQRDAGAVIDNRAFEPGYLDQIRLGYPFHPEFIRLFAERLADIPEFQATRGALRLISRTIRAAWSNRNDLRDAFLLQPQHVDLTRSDVRDEILARLNRSPYERGLEADVIKSAGDSHAQLVEKGWPWRAATEASLVAFLHSLPEGSRGITPAEAALAVGRPEVDLAYVGRGLEETERRGWYMRHEGDHYLFRTRASINKRFQERSGQVQGAEVRETLDQWVQEIYSGFTAFQVVPFPQDHTAMSDTADRIRLAIIHYDTECGVVGAGNRLNFTKKLFTQTGVNQSARRYRNNLIFLLAESTRVDGLKDAVRSLIAWERVQTDIELEQSTLAESSGSEFRSLKDMARRGASGVPAEFMALEYDLGEVKEKLGVQELNVRSKLLDAYRVLAFPKGGADDDDEAGLFTSAVLGTLLECFRVDFGERPDDTRKGKKSIRQAVAEQPILQCLRENNKLVPEQSADNPLVLAPAMLRQPPLWNPSEQRVSTNEVWDRLRRDPELPMLLRETDLLPTLRAGLTTDPDALWLYYIQPEKKLFTRDNAAGLSPVIDDHHFLYDPVAAIPSRIVPVVNLSPQEIWDYLWPRSGTEFLPSVSSNALLSRLVDSSHFPVVPSRDVLWRGLQDGARDNRWVLYLKGPNLAIGAAEIGEWPGTPRFDDATELWAYQAALDADLYPRDTIDPTLRETFSVTALYEKCWPAAEETIGTEDMERCARATWPELPRPRLEVALLEGLKASLWSVWKRGADEIFYTSTDPLQELRVGADWMLVAPASQTSKELDPIRPGRGPQPIRETGTPRAVLVKIWEELGAYKDVVLNELTITATDRDTLDNTLLATWADRPTVAQAHASIRAVGQREINGTAETAELTFEGRFEEIRSMLAPVWPFAHQGELDVTIALRLSFAPPLPLGDPALDAYRNALMNANQGEIEVLAVPARMTQREIS